MKHIYILIGIIFLNISCNDEGFIPSNREIDWTQRLDFSLPQVKEYYEKYGVGIMTNYDPILDFLYEQDVFWYNTVLTKLERKTEIDSALIFLNETLLKYFNNDNFIKEYFPRKLLLTREVYIGQENSYCPEALESDLRRGSSLINSLHSVYNKNAHAFSIKLKTIYFDEENYKGYKFDNFYIFLANLFERNKLYDVFDAKFYLPEMEPYYRRTFTGEGNKENKYTPGVWIEEGNSLNDQFVHKSWYWNKGFVSTKNCNEVITRENNKDNIYLKDISNNRSYAFPDKKREVRNLLNQMIYVSIDVYNEYPEIIKNRFAILMEKFDEWGIDIRSLNPAMNEAFPRNL